MKIVVFKYNFIKISCERSNETMIYAIIVVLGDGLVLNRQQVITLTNYGPFHRRVLVCVTIGHVVLGKIVQ